MKGFLVSLFFFAFLSCEALREGKCERKEGEGEILDKSSMEAKSCSTAGEMYRTLFHHILLYFSTKIESLAFSSRAGRVKGEGLASEPAV